MKRPLEPRKCWAVSLLLVSPVLGVPLVAEETEYLPTPYTAEQIREAYAEGFVVDTETWKDGTVEVRRSRVVENQPDTVRLTDQALDAEGRPTGEIAEYEAPWTALRDHAKFSVDRAERARDSRETQLGTFEGWTYTLPSEDPDTYTEMFFADSLPGPPLVYLQIEDGETTLRAEQVARSGD